MILDQLFEDNNKKKLNEVDPRNFDSDEDYYAAVRGGRRSSYDDDDYDDYEDEEVDDMDDDESYYEKYVRTKNLEEENLDEISLDQIGRGVGGVLGGIGKTVGAVAGVPQGIGRAIKKGYRGAVQGIGGSADTGVNPATDVPGAAYGGKEVPTATGMINPATGRAYVPSDFGDEEASAEQRTASVVQQDIKNLDTQYRTQMRQLQSELQQAQSQPADDLTQAQKDYIAAIGTDEPAAAATTTGAAPTGTDPRQLLKSIQTLDQAQLAIVKKMLQAQARQTANENAQLDEVDWKGIQKKAAQWQKGAEKFTKNVAQTGQALGGAAGAIGGAAKEVGKQFVAKPVAATYNAAKSGLGKAANIAKGVYGDVAQGVKTVGQAGSQVGRDVAKTAGYAATGVGAVAGGVKGLGAAAKQGFATGAQNVGGMNMNNIQLAVSSLTPQQAKQALAVVNQLMKKPAAKKKKAATKTTAQTPTWTGRPAVAAPATVTTESLTWTKGWDPSESLLRKLH